MLTYIFIVLFVAVSVISVLLRKAYNVVPAAELQRRAANGNELAVALYRAVGFGVSLRALLWIGIIAGSAISSVLLAGKTPALVSIPLISLLTWLNFVGLPKSRVSTLTMNVAKRLTPVVVWKLQYLDAPLRWLAAALGRYNRQPHSGLYEMQDMLDLLDLQAAQTDSRITPEEISLMRQVLSFNDRLVRDCMRARKGVRSVSSGDAIGPVLLDELHASGQTSFPVKKTTRSSEIIGSLQLGDIGIHSTGTVNDYAVKSVNYVHESSNLAEALRGFYQTKQQLFIVVDDEDEYVGVLTLEDILHTLVGPAIAGATILEVENSIK